MLALDQFLQYRQVGRWSDYLVDERTYITLSLVAKSLLAWQVFGGTLPVVQFRLGGVLSPRVPPPVTGQCACGMDAQ